MTVIRIVIPSVFPVYIIVHITGRLIRVQNFLSLSHCQSERYKQGRCRNHEKKCIDAIAAGRQIRTGYRSAERQENPRPAADPGSRHQPLRPGAFHQPVSGKIDLRIFAVHPVCLPHNSDMQHQKKKTGKHAGRIQRPFHRHFRRTKPVSFSHIIQKQRCSRCQNHWRQVPFPVKRHFPGKRRHRGIDPHHPHARRVHPSTLKFQTVHLSMRNNNQPVKHCHIFCQPYGPYNNKQGKIIKAQETDKHTQQQIDLMKTIPMLLNLSADFFHFRIFHSMSRNMNPHYHPFSVLSLLPVRKPADRYNDQVTDQKDKKQSHVHIYTSLSAGCMLINISLYIRIAPDMIQAPAAPAAITSAICSSV